MCLDEREIQILLRNRMEERSKRISLCDVSFAEIAATKLHKNNTLTQDAPQSPPPSV